MSNDDLNINNKIVIEEQSSGNVKIDKLLRNASKHGNGKGYPDFIVQYSDNPDFIIIIECKADVAKHRSSDEISYKDFAIDGVKLYASFLSKEYNVLAIAISGSDENIRISHFLHLEGTPTAYSIFSDDKLLTLNDYLKGCNEDERKFNQDFQELLRYSKCLNDQLHSLKVKESERSLLISGTLIALSDKAFKASYKLEAPQSLANLLVNKIEEILSNVQNKHIKDIVTSYSFIKTHTILAKDDKHLQSIISEIDTKINYFIKNYQYFDTLGQFYIEFLRYANNDKGLGIVLTPPHITELFCDIANVNKDSIVLDTCTGTGGFLISAMKKMIIDSAGETNKERNIKQNQLVGVEIQHDLYSLLCSNMYIHGDGRSNLIKGDCFDPVVVNQIAKFNPNVGFLNPPYKTPSDNKYEFEFIINNLERLEKGSYCVSIIPMSCVLSNHGKQKELKEKLLSNHTLEAVFSMPDELFENSEVGAVTAIVVFKAKEKHPHDYKTYFGYWKDDGFYKKKTSGRADYDNKWSKIKDCWLKHYRNKDETEGHSIKKVVSASDEWCAEAHMKTSYEDLNEELFEKEILKYSTYLFSNKKRSCVSSNSISKEKIILNIADFKEFNLKELFSIVKGSDSATYTMGKIPVISATSYNNGISGYVDEAKKLFQPNTITVASNGSIGEAFFQNEAYCATGDVNILDAKFNLNVYIGIFIITLISLEKYKFNYGRKWGKERMEKSTIKLPIKMNGDPDWELIENYIKSLPYSHNL